LWYAAALPAHWPEETVAGLPQAGRLILHFSAFDPYQAGESRVHRLDPRVKVVLAAGFILSMALLPDAAWLAYGLAFLLVLAAAVAAGIPPRRVLRRSLIGLPFLLAAVTVLFTLPGATLWRGPFGLMLTDAGLERFLSIVCRSLISLQMAILLTMTTRFPDIIHALRHLKVPAVLTSIIAFMYRYLFVLADEAARLMRGRAARSAAAPGNKAGGSLVWRAMTTGHMVGQLFIRSLDRSERVYQAMVARGYRGELLTMHPHAMRPADWGTLIAFFAALLLIQAVARLPLGGI
jgi:cobalt/nickel transport system permease protein